MCLTEAVLSLPGSRTRRLQWEQRQCRRGAPERLVFRNWRDSMMAIKVAATSKDDRRP